VGGQEVNCGAGVLAWPQTRAGEVSNQRKKTKRRHSGAAMYPGRLSRVSKIQDADPQEETMQEEREGPTLKWKRNDSKLLINVARRLPAENAS